MTDTPDGRGLGTLISDLAQQVTTLLQTEGKLFRSEMSDKLSKVGAGGMEVLAGAMCLLAALIVLLQALVIALANAGLGAGWSSLLVGVAVAALGLILLRGGTATMQLGDVSPDRTAEQLKRDVRVVKEQIK